ncbi:globin domain-containing protein [Streptomyces sp. NPDC002306]
MDAPTTASADNGTSGGGSGWFIPRKDPESPPGGEREAADGSRLAAMRPMGRTHSASGSGPLTQAAAEADPVAAPIDPRIRPPADAPHTAHRTPPAESAPPVFPGTSPTASESRPTGLRPAAAEPSATRSTAPDPAPTVAPSAAPNLASAASTGRPAPDARPPASAAPPSASASASASAEQHLPARWSAPAVRASPDALLIRRTMAEVAPVADKVTSYFYALLFVRHPELRSLFPAAMDTQRDRLLKALLTAAEHIDNTPVLVDYLQNLGRGHRKYGTRAEHYPAVGECLIGALAKFASAVWDGETEAAWVRAYTTISQVMIDAAAVDELRAPPWWHAQVVSHDLRTPDVAVVTVRPDQPYPFLAGQYTSVETPWWPRVWRHYSFASAPRSDGLLTFHVKAVPAGWVSNALVHRARPGDVIRLGPPTGSMTVDHTSGSGLLCLGGGTGIAPIKALVEDVAEHGERRPVEVFYGARTGDDLYDIDTMLRLQQSHPWLSVRAVVDQQAHVQLPDAIRAYGPWNEYDAYLSGPPGMIRSGVDALRDIGIPTNRIRHDAVEELVVTGN